MFIDKANPASKTVKAYTVKLQQEEDQSLTTLNGHNPLEDQIHAVAETSKESGDNVTVKTELAAARVFCFDQDRSEDMLSQADYDEEKEQVAELEEEAVTDDTGGATDQQYSFMQLSRDFKNSLAGSLRDEQIEFKEPKPPRHPPPRHLVLEKSIAEAPWAKLRRK